MLSHKRCLSNFAVLAVFPGLKNWALFPLSPAARIELLNSTVPLAFALAKKDCPAAI
ncbi:hypothetical protein D3C85_1435310 [compost metagenome]